ncbi:unnamed protein product [Acanthoscelides obtectus]|uniref:Uncharacterized protein n=1 Tax=Acanthoscelides obtectus TaxID=200917 RepID=A0A9P0JWI3_ACAOB|nr:unnamed protein product [Acanthoscelides obtectus]CAK1632054.1 hypothetical protein AOBTE_LOCUS7332 [Acanthoscelides obtectus]
MFILGQYKYLKLNFFFFSSSSSVRAVRRTFAPG